MSINMNIPSPGELIHVQSSASISEMLCELYQKL